MVNIFTDGASRGNPKSACSFLIINDNKEIATGSRYLGIATNNVAEYSAILDALIYCKNHDYLILGDKHHIVSDSKLVINQLTGEYKLNNSNLKKIYDEIKSLIDPDIIVEYKWVPRTDEFIKKCDKLNNKTLDKY